MLRAADSCHPEEEAWQLPGKQSLVARGPEDRGAFRAAESSHDLCEGRGDKWVFLKICHENMFSVWQPRDTSQLSANSALPWIRTKVWPGFWASEKHNQIAQLSHRKS